MDNWWDIEDVFNGGAKQPFAVVIDYEGALVVSFHINDDTARNQAQALLDDARIRRVAVVDASAPEARLVVEVDKRPSARDMALAALRFNG